MDVVDGKKTCSRLEEEEVEVAASTKPGLVGGSSDAARLLRWVRSRNVYRPRTGGIDAIDGGC